MTSDVVITLDHRNFLCWFFAFSSSTVSVASLSPTTKRCIYSDKPEFVIKIVDLKVETAIV